MFSFNIMLCNITVIYQYRYSITTDNILAYMDYLELLVHLAETLCDHESNSKQKIYLEIGIHSQGPVIRDSYPIVSVFSGVPMEMRLVPVWQRDFTRSYTVVGSKAAASG